MIFRSGPQKIDLTIELSIQTLNAIINYTMSSSRVETFKCSVEDLMQANNIYNWKLTLLTQHTQSKQHKYTLVFAASSIETVSNSSSETSPIDADPSETAHASRIKTFKHIFHDYFNIYDFEDDNGIPIAYTRMRDPMIDYETNEFVTTIIVQYYNNHRPYPIRQMSDIERRLRAQIGRLTVDRERLLIANRHETRKVRTIGKDLVAERALRTHMGEGFRHLVVELYSLIDVEHHKDCSVCYEEITPENIMIKNCRHMICSTCSERCTQCPECRASYSISERV